MGGKLSIAFSALAIMMGAVLNTGTAPVFSQSARHAPGPTSIRPARFRLDKDRGLLLQTWINGAGPYIFAIDTGAGLNLISERIVQAARLQVKTTQTTLLGGLTGVRGSTNRAAEIDQMALGDSSNFLPSKQTALIVTLPPNLDGILDPTETYAPQGYSIDIPNQLIRCVCGKLARSTAIPRRRNCLLAPPRRRHPAFCKVERRAFRAPRYGFAIWACCQRTRRSDSRRHSPQGKHRERPRHWRRKYQFAASGADDSQYWRT